MASPYIHSLNSVKKWGGKWENYYPIHEFLDSSKYHYANWRHRSILHHSFGVQICVTIFGAVIDNGEGNNIEVKYIAEKHIIEDCGYIPTVKDWIFDLTPKKFAINTNNINNKNYEDGK